jgi:hypothetical protein
MAAGLRAADHRRAADTAAVRLDTELRRAVRTLDLGRVRSLLAGAVRTGVRITPLAVQASSLLQRLAAAA